uniref:Uncharacterized protein n=1 Tax=Lepeophtheirus salmonis TaxID=72036 RepID=A0A0K2TC87_LEPSM
MDLRGSVWDLFFHSFGSNWTFLTDPFFLSNVTDLITA